MRNKMLLSSRTVRDRDTIEEDRDEDDGRKVCCRRMQELIGNGENRKEEMREREVRQGGRGARANLTGQTIES